MSKVNQLVPEDVGKWCTLEKAYSTVGTLKDEIVVVVKHLGGGIAAGQKTTLAVVPNQAEMDKFIEKAQNASPSDNFFTVVKPLARFFTDKLSNRSLALVIGTGAEGWTSLFLDDAPRIKLGEAPMDQTPKAGVEFLGTKFSAILPVVGEGGTVDAVSAEWTVGDVFADNNNLRVTAKVDGSDVETILSVSAVAKKLSGSEMHEPLLTGRNDMI